MPILKNPINILAYPEHLRDDRSRQQLSLDFWIEHTGLKNVASHVGWVNAGADNPYHNTDHCFGVAELALLLLRHSLNNPTSLSDVRVILAACLFHDFDHTGADVPDSINIHNACAGASMPLTLAGVSKEEIQEVTKLIQVTEFPFKHRPTTLHEKIIRDADLLWLSTRADPIPPLLGLYGEVSKKAANKDLILSTFLKSNVEFVDSCKLFTHAGVQAYAACRPTVVDAIQKYLAENNLV